ncbi:HpcH/HpaI aldolase/citrate lyase family protein [Oceanicaulis sp. LC35]|uniref:HpcH/HpaI aldolase/citrate lyase family protein n=1 Tax=Oceanicaulis sp. LC35 TaxID=3349635 RepID=UPI003F84A5FB
MMDDSSHTLLNARLMRSVLFVPGDKPRALDKAPGLGADAIILDLEDAVAPERKSEARAQARETIPRFRAQGLYTVLRIAEPGSPDLAADLPVASAARPDAVLIAKVETPDQLASIRQRLDQAGYDGPVWAMIETPLGVLNVDAIARQAQFSRLEALVAGANDLAVGLHLPDTDQRREVLTPHLSRLVLAARAMKLLVLDSVFNAYKDEPGFEAEARQGRALGFDGKTLIHPSQIQPVHRAYAPSARECDWAQKVVDAFADPAHAGKGAVPVEGRMVEHMHLRAARAVLAAAQTRE